MCLWLSVIDRIGVIDMSDNNDELDNNEFNEDDDPNLKKLSKIELLTGLSEEEHIQQRKLAWEEALVLQTHHFCIRHESGKGAYLPIDEFYQYGAQATWNNPHGCRSYCRACQRNVNQEYYKTRGGNNSNSWPPPLELGSRPDLKQCYYLPHILISPQAEMYSLKSRRWVTGTMVGGFRRMGQLAVAHMVLATFRSPPPPNVRGVRYLDNNPLNCHLTNLEWRTQSYDVAIKKNQLEQEFKRIQAELAALNEHNPEEMAKLKPLEKKMEESEKKTLANLSNKPSSNLFPSREAEEATMNSNKQHLNILDRISSTKN